MKYASELPHSQSLGFGVVVKATVVETGKSARLRVKFSDGTFDETTWTMSRDIAQAAGALVLIQIDNEGNKTLHWV
jgi:hypothetical protein